jgi:hypothetical protein
MAQIDNKFVNLTKRHGLFCIEKYGKKFEVLEPQPEQKQLLVIQRAYNKLKKDQNYKRRISWIQNDPTGKYTKNSAIFEYLGKFPGRQVHGLVKNKDSNQPYVKTKPSMKAKAANMIKHNAAKNVHDELNEGTDIYELPRNLKQIQNMKYIYDRKNKTTSNNVHLKNVADHLIHTANRVYQGHPFIRSVVHLQSGPSVLLYTDEQINDIKRLCCIDDPAILGVDKTYNLGELHLTTTVFKNKSVIRTNTGENPIFLGPCVLHRKSDFETFNGFFTNLASHLTDEEITKMVIGSDDEYALRKSIARAFRGSTQIICTRHLKNNVNDYLGKKVGAKENVRKEIINAMFGDEGLTEANSTIVFDQKLQNLKSELIKKADNFLPYFEKRIEPLIKEKVNIPTRLKKMDKDWTNNNAESMNNILKIGTNHKLEDMTDLIEIIYKIVKSQYKDCEKAVVGMGNFKLAPTFQHHYISADVWCQKTEEERKKYMDKFHRDKGKFYTTVTSTNGILTVPKTPNGGKKPHQRKRTAAERTNKRWH